MGRVEKSINGVMCLIKNEKYYFCLRDAARVFGYKNLLEAKEKCKKLDESIRLTNGSTAIVFDDLIELSKHCAKIPNGFIEALQKEIVESREKSKEKIEINGAPDFNNPAEMARAWAALYDEREKAKKELDAALERLGEGKEYKIVSAIPWLCDYFELFRMGTVAGVIGAKLTAISRTNNIAVKKCQPFPHRKTGTLGMYSVQAINIFKEFLDKNPYFLVFYRKSQKEKLEEK